MRNLAVAALLGLWGGCGVGGARLHLVRSARLRGPVHDAAPLLAARGNQVQRQRQLKGVEKKPTQQAAKNAVANGTAGLAGTSWGPMTSSCVPEGMRRVPVLGGAFDMVVRGTNDIVSNEIATKGFWEILDPQQIASATGRELPPGGLFLDVGANIGYYSLLFARKGYRVIAVEPMTGNRAALEGSLCLNPELRNLITVLPVALGSHEETGSRCTVWSSNEKINVGNGIMRCGSEADNCPANNPNCEVVSVHTLDSVLSQFQIPHIEVVKMDIESHECEVLSGGQALFQSNYPRFLKMETTVADSMMCVHREASKHGYRVYRMGDDTVMAK